MANAIDHLQVLHLLCSLSQLKPENYRCDLNSLVAKNALIDYLSLIAVDQKSLPK